MRRDRFWHSGSFPGASAEQHQDWEHLQPSQDHSKGQHQLAQHRESGEISRRAHQFQAGAHIADAGDHRRQGGAEGEVVQPHHNGHTEHEKQVGDEIALGGADGALAHRSPVQPDHRYCPGVDDGAHLPAGGADKDQNAPAFDAASGRPAAGPDECEHHQQHFGELRPQIVVVGGKARGGHNGRHLEGGIADTVPHSGVHIPDVPCDGGDGHRHHDEEKPQLIAFQRLPDLAGEQQKIDGEVDGEQQHKHRDDDLNGGAVKGPHRGVHTGEAAGARRGHGVGDGVIPVHPRHAQQQHLQHRQSQIDGVQNLGGLGGPGHQLALYRAGALGADEEIGADPQKGQQGGGEDEHSHPPQPVSKGPPKQQAHGQAFNGGEDGGPCGGKAGDSLKKAVDEGPELAGKPEGQRPEHPEQHPDQPHGEKTFPSKKVRLGLEEKHRHGGGRQDDEDGAQKGDRALPVEQGHRHGEQHGRRFKEQGEAGDAQHQFKIHSLSPPRPARCRRRCR